MDIQNAQILTSTIWTSVITALASGGVVSAAVNFLLRDWISERLRQSIQHEYSQKLETYKAELQAQQEVALARLRSVQNLAATSFVETRKAAQERQFKAIEQLWAIILELGQSLPPAVMVIDVLPAEQRHFLSDPAFREKQLEDVSWMNLATKIIKPALAAESARLFAGQYLYSLLFAYRALIGRIYTFLLDLREKKGETETAPWYEDAEVRALLGTILTEDECEAFYSRRNLHYDWLRNLIEQKFVQYANEFASGNVAAETAVEQAGKIIEAAMRITSREQRDER